MERILFSKNEKTVFVLDCYEIAVYGKKDGESKRSEIYLGDIKNILENIPSIDCGESLVIEKKRFTLDKDLVDLGMEVGLVLSLNLENELTCAKFLILTQS